MLACYFSEKGITLFGEFPRHKPSVFSIDQTLIEQSSDSPAWILYWHSKFQTKAVNRARVAKFPFSLGLSLRRGGL